MRGCGPTLTLSRVWGPRARSLDQPAQAPAGGARGAARAAAALRRPACARAACREASRAAAPAQKRCTAAKPASATGISGAGRAEAPAHPCTHPPSTWLRMPFGAKPLHCRCRCRVSIGLHARAGGPAPVDMALGALAGSAAADVAALILRPDFNQLQARRARPAG